MKNSKTNRKLAVAGNLPRYFIMACMIAIPLAFAACDSADDSESIDAVSGEVEPGGFTETSTAAAATAEVHASGAWERMDMPNVGDIWTLKSVVFTGQTEGWAVGSDESSAKGVVLHFSNGRWSIDFMPASGKMWTVHLLDIALDSPNSGWAVGNKYYIWGDPDKFRPFAVRMQNGRWSIVKIPDVNGQSYELESVATVPENGYAYAVGGVTTKDKRREGLIMVFDGRRWMRMPNPAVNSTWWELHEVVFTSADRGWAFGKTVHPKETDNSLLILEYSAGQWKQVATPDARGLKRSLLSASFPAADVGYAAGQGAILKYSNGAWAKDKVEGDIDNWMIKSIFFTSKDDGWAVGWDDSKKKPLWLRRNASGWQIVPTSYDESLQELNDVFFVTPQLGFAAGSMSWRDGYPGVVFSYTAPR